MPTRGDSISERRALRAAYRRSRRALTESQQRTHARAVKRHFMRSMWWLNARNIGLYAAADGEVDLAPLTLALHRMGKRLALPVIEPAGSMRFYRYRPGDRTVRNRYNISEPASAASPSGPLELLLVPLVAFDAEGNRLGMGAGYYDRYAARHPCRLVGVAHDCQRATALPVAPWDQPLHGVVTESGFVSFGS